MEAVLHGVHYFAIFQNHILKFQKILKTILDVDNVVFYQRVKYQLKYLILGCTKIIKSDI